MSERLKNKTVIITGGASGIGRETALLFAREGAKVIIADINEIKGREALLGVEKNGGQGMFIKWDVTDREQGNQAVKEIMEKYSKIDVLINNGGITMDSLINKMRDDQWDQVIGVDLTGVYNCIHAVVNAMIMQGYGAIINTSSVVGLFGNVGQVNYASAKAGLIGMTKALAKELGKKGIRVNAVAPGFIQTPMTASVPEKILEGMKEKTPLRKLGEPIDVAYAYLYLASDEARYVNGAVLSVDGGLVI